MLSSSGYWIFSHPEICSGDQSRISLLATMFRNLRLTASRHFFGRKAESQAGHPHHGRDRPDGHRGEKSPGSLWRPLDPVVEQSHEAANPEAIPREMSSRSAKRERQPRAATSGGRNASARQQHTRECSYAACQRRAQSHAATVPPSSGSKSSRFSIAESPNRFPGLIQHHL